LFAALIRAKSARTIVNYSIEQLKPSKKNRFKNAMCHQETRKNRRGFYAEKIGICAILTA
jgi:hypothetical protein